MNWLNCNNFLVAMDKVCYIQFLNEEIPTAHVYFVGRKQPLSIEAESMEELISYFHDHTIEKGKQ